MDRQGLIWDFYHHHTLVHRHLKLVPCLKKKSIAQQMPHSVLFLTLNFLGSQLKDREGIASLLTIRSLAKRGS